LLCDEKGSGGGGGAMFRSPNSFSVSHQVTLIMLDAKPRIKQMEGRTASLILVASKKSPTVAAELNKGMWSRDIDSIYNN